MDYEELMHRLRHCDECDCAHSEPDFSCICECHEPVPEHERLGAWVRRPEPN